MKNIKFGIPILALILAVNLANSQAVGQAAIKEIDGVKHVLNPEKPSKGTIQLEVEKALTINPFDQPGVGMKWLQFIRDNDGALILYDPRTTEAHRFGPKGEYLGSFIKKGQGPGEFPAGDFFTPFFLGGRIWVAGGMKLAEFDKDGRYLREQTLKNRLSILINEGLYLTERSEWNEDRSVQTKTISLVRITKESLSDVRVADILQGIGIGLIMNKTGKSRFADTFGTPNLCFAYGREAQKIYAALNTEYKIIVKNLKGETLSVIEKAHENVRVGRKDVETMLGKIVKNDTSKWILDAYPDRLVALNEIRPLPNGYLLVRRVSGLKEFEMDVFDAEGRYVYALKPPKGMSFFGVVFHNNGFSTIDSTGEYPLYINYRIANLPDIFGK